MRMYRTARSGSAGGGKGKNSLGRALDGEDPKTWLSRETQRKVGSLTGRAAWRGGSDEKTTRLGTPRLKAKAEGLYPPEGLEKG